MTIPISGDLLPPDPASRKRPAAKVSVSEQSHADSAPDERKDHTSILSSSPESLKTYVNMLKHLNPVSLHRIEELRQRIRSGEYQANPDDMAGPLTELLSRERPGDHSA